MHKFLGLAAAPALQCVRLGGSVGMRLRTLSQEGRVGRCVTRAAVVALLGSGESREEVASFPPRRPAALPRSAAFSARRLRRHRR